MRRNSAILGAAFLMATSAIGPGFLTQTSLFTEQLLTSFGFVILVSILLDIGVQLNIWRIVVQSGKRAQDLANSVIRGSGYILAALIAFGGLAFNTGNIAGCGLGIEVLTGLSPVYGAMISCVIVLIIFWSKDALKVIDRLVQILGLLMIGLTLYVAISSQPPLASALQHTFIPEKIDVLMIITIVGGTVGGYISFAGAHRLLEARKGEPGDVNEVNRSAISGILITSFMRFILFLAVLGVVMSGVRLSSENPAATVFQSAAGNVGYLFFGIVLWCAAISSVIGASYTTVSFWKTLHPLIARHEKWFISGFILVSTVIFIGVGKPVVLLVLAGAVNGLILPFALALILIAASKAKAASTYKHPNWLFALGIIVVGVLGWLGYLALVEGIGKL